MSQGIAKTLDARTLQILDASQADVDRVLTDLFTAVTQGEDDHGTELETFGESVRWLAHQHPHVPLGLIHRLVAVGDDLYGAIWERHDADRDREHRAQEDA